MGVYFIEAAIATQSGPDPRWKPHSSERTMSAWMFPTSSTAMATSTATRTIRPYRSNRGAERGPSRLARIDTMRLPAAKTLDCLRHDGVREAVRAVPPGAAAHWRRAQAGGDADTGPRLPAGRTDGAATNRHSAAEPEPLVAVVLPPRVVRLARLVALAVIVGVGVSELWFAVSQWTMTDSAAYWNAAMRLREGAPLYPVVGNVEASDVYRYAPWFAWLTVPFTYLPIWLAGAIWSLILVAGSVAAVVPLARRGAWIQVAFFFPILIGISAYGNVQALLVASLVWTVED